MKIYTNKLSQADLSYAAPSDCYLEVQTFTPRRRVHPFLYGYDIHMSAPGGEDVHGIPRRYHLNSGTYGAVQGFDRAPTWVEWGDMIAKLFKLDPQAHIGNYKNRASFIALATAAAPNRPADEDAISHVGDWERDLFETHAMYRSLVS